MKLMLIPGELGKGRGTGGVSLGIGYASYLFKAEKSRTQSVSSAGLLRRSLHRTLRAILASNRLLWVSGGMVPTAFQQHSYGLLL